MLTTCDSRLFDMKFAVDARDRVWIMQLNLSGQQKLRVSATANCNHHFLQLPVKGCVSDTNTVVSCDGGSVDVDVSGIF